MRQISILLLLCAIGCGPVTEYSDEKTEPATVYDVAFVPAGHGHDTAIGFTGKGDMTVTPIDINIPERFAVVFKCQHGKFVINGDKARDLYQRLDKGMKVTVRYRDVIQVSTKNGKEVRSVVDLDFIDASPSEAESTAGL